LDLSLPGDRIDPGVLVAAAERIAAALRASGLFLSVGGREYGDRLAGLMTILTSRLPLLFDERELRDRIADSLRPDRIRSALRDDAALLRSLDGIGQAELTARDPLGWRSLILSRLGLMLPRLNAQVMRGQILSADERHLLLPAQPTHPGTDTVFAARIHAAIQSAAEALGRESPENGRDVQVLCVGAFRSTLDNERYSRQDARRAAMISILGIGILLGLTFPRPWLGLLCLVPAVAGTALSLFTISLVQRNLSILALGFGGALIGIAVDQGIAYFAFLDRAEKSTSGWEASASVWVVSLAATLTTVGSFLALQFSGFPMMRQLGLFAALGVFFAFLFVHLVFPLVFKIIPPAPNKKKRAERLTRLTTFFALAGGRNAAILVMILALGLAWFARPRFEGDLRALNTVSPDTIRSERAVQAVWGDVLRNVYVLLEAETPEALQARSDGLAGFFLRQEAEDRIAASFTPSMVLPGPDAAAANLAAWRTFWTSERIAAVRSAMHGPQAELGFSARAFAPFFRLLESPSAAARPVPPSLYPLLGIVRSRDGAQWLSLNPVAPGSRFERDAFARRVKDLPGARILDYELFADRLAGLLVGGFSRMLLICIGGLALVLILFFFEATIPLLVLGHTVFALVCTLGTLKLIGQPMNIPGLALAIIIPGMGSDFALFFARSYQRYLDERRPSMAVFRNAVFLSAASAMIGFAGLAAGRHVLLRSIGLTGLLAIGYSALGAFVLLPPVLRRVFRTRPWPPVRTAGLSPDAIRTRVRRRFRHLEVFVRLLARFKLRLDPMFPKLAEFVPERGLVLVLGCGYGVPGAWLLARSPALRLAGWEPDARRAAVARHVFGDRGEVTTGAAPELPGEPGPVEAALLLDVVHKLPDEALRTIFQSLARCLRPDGRLVIRATVPGTAKVPWLMGLDGWKWTASRRAVRFRTPDELKAAAAAAGFVVERLDACAFGPRAVWLVVKR
ncbi:MAG: MMPL family transporter, partial [Candidatus Aminicenantales bacterium]